jgi:hypothetical protein
LWTPVLHSRRDKKSPLLGCVGPIATLAAGWRALTATPTLPEANANAGTTPPPRATGRGRMTVCRAGQEASADRKHWFLGGGSCVVSSFWPNRPLVPAKAGQGYRVLVGAAPFHPKPMVYLLLFSSGKGGKGGKGYSNDTAAQLLVHLSRACTTRSRCASVPVT